ncbi:MAG TPA: ABC transporter substrate-binding protein [Burkholderiales bacterium]|nr:ABC transporter substrate-binding protein [Burkholderiales bacterium]
MRLLALFASLLLAVPALAQELGPDELVRKVTSDVLDAIKSDKQLQAGDRKKALALAEQKVLPHVDFTEAVKLAAGKTWNTATPDQQQKLAREFRSMLIRIYSNAIDSYRGQTMKVLPLHMAPNATEVTVRNQYLRPGQPPVPIEYAMKKTPEGWKIYDITIEGVSLVLTYRAEFEQISRTSGIEGLIKRLQEKNA